MDKIFCRGYLTTVFVISVVILLFCFSGISAYAFVEDSELRLATEVFAEAGAEVMYESPDTLVIRKENKFASMKFNSRIVYRDGMCYTLDREVVVYESRSYVSPDAVEKVVGQIGERIVDPDRPMVCLTFDDGPFSPTTDAILDVFEKYNSKATFFVVGDMIWQYPQTLKRASQLEMELGNHTYYHPRLSKCMWDRVANEILMTDHDARLVTGKGLDIMRPPHCDYNKMVCDASGMPVVLWSLDTLDWYNLDPGVIYNRVLDNVKDGDVVLMHDTLDCTRIAISWMVPDLIERGFQLVTVKEMFEAKSESPEAAGVYCGEN